MIKNQVTKLSCIYYYRSYLKGQYAHAVAYLCFKSVFVLSNMECQMLAWRPAAVYMITLFLKPLTPKPYSPIPPVWRNFNSRTQSSWEHLTSIGLMLNTQAGSGRHRIDRLSVVQLLCAVRSLINHSIIFIIGAFRNAFLLARLNRDSSFLQQAQSQL